MQIKFVTDEILEVPFNTLAAVNLNGLNLHRAILEDMDLHDTSFIKTDLRGAFIANSNLSNCNFTEASLITAYCMNSILKGANLQHCRAIGCNFAGANLNDADILETDFSYSDLRGTKMLCKNINSAKFTDALYDSSTVWPNGFDPAKVGCLKDNS